MTTTPIIILLILFVILIVSRYYKNSNSYKEFPDYTNNLGSDNSYIDFREFDADLCDNDGLVSSHRLSLSGYMVIKIKTKIIFDPSEPAINEGQIVVIDNRFKTLQESVNKGDLVLVKNMDSQGKNNPEYEEYLGKISTIHKDGSVTIVRNGRRKKKMIKAFIIGKIIKIS